MNAAPPTASTHRRPPGFDIDRAMSLVSNAVRPFPKAAMFELRDDGYNSVFEQVIACLLSIRTYDEVSIEASRRLFAIARTPKDLAAMPAEEIDVLIEDVTYHERKAPQIVAIATRTLAMGGELPCDDTVLQSLPGVGPKCAHLALGIACGQPVISVDTHVHRITNRWGYVQARTPEQTMTALELTLPKAYWVRINEMLVPFGKHICLSRKPRCSICPLRDMCERVGVTSPQ
ncbi:MAG: endonuclease III [Thermomicrobiales bacterium]